MSPAADEPAVPENEVHLPPNGKTVLVVGGGLSGLIAACEAADRGFSVTVLERNGSAGGQLHDWRDKTFGRPSADSSWKGHPLEVSSHFIPCFHRNLREFLARRGVGLRDRGINAPGSPWSLYRAGGAAEESVVSRAPAPLHARGVFASLRRLNRDGGPLLGLRALADMLSFDGEDPREIETLDGLSVSQWRERAGLPRDFDHAFFAPFLGSLTYSSTDHVSALFWMRLTSASFGHWRDMFELKIFPDAKAETVIAPLVRHLMERGGRVLCGAEALSFKVSGGRVKALEAACHSVEDAGRFCPLCGEARRAGRASCHRCGRPWEGGGRPPERRTLEADYFVLASDIPGAQRLFSAEPFRSEPFFKGVHRLPTAAYLQAYLWYPQTGGKRLSLAWQERFGDREIVFANDPPFTGSFVNYSRFRAGSFQGFDDADVIMTSVPDKGELGGLDAKAFGALLDRRLRAMMPELPPWEDCRVLRGDNFATMGVGSEKDRPAVVTPYQNLLIIGDYVRLKHNAVHMERGAVSAKAAVNRLLELTGQREGRITILPSQTPHPAVAAARRVASAVRRLRRAAGA